MTGIQHNRPDGTECLSLAVTSCRECGWTEPARDKLTDEEYGRQSIGDASSAPLHVRVQRMRRIATQWAAQAPPDDWGESMAGTIAADCGRVVLTTLGDGEGSPSVADGLPPGHVLVSREDLRAALLLIDLHAPMHMREPSDALDRLFAATKAGE